MFSQRVDSLIAEVVELTGSAEPIEVLLVRGGLLDLANADLISAERVLRQQRNELYRSARRRGWDMDLLDERIEAHRRAVRSAWEGTQGEQRQSP